MGLEPGVAEWKMQTNTLSYDGTPKYQKSWHRSFCWKSVVFKAAQKVAKYLGYFCKKICHQVWPKNIPIWSHWLWLLLLKNRTVDELNTPLWNFGQKLKYLYIGLTVIWHLAIQHLFTELLSKLTLMWQNRILYFNLCLAWQVIRLFYNLL